MKFLTAPILVSQTERGGGTASSSEENAEHALDSERAPPKKNRFWRASSVEPRFRSSRQRLLRGGAATPDFRGNLAAWRGSAVTRASANRCRIVTQARRGPGH